MLFQNVIVFGIIAYVVEELLPKEEYKKYIRMYTGIGMIIIVLSGVMQLLHTDFALDDFVQRYILKEEMSAELDGVELYEDYYYQAILEEYTDNMKGQIRKLVAAENMAANDIVIDINLDTESANFFEIEQISITIAPLYQDDSIKIKNIVIAHEQEAESIVEINIKNRISQFYNIPVEHINVIK